MPTVAGRAFLREAEVAVSASERARATARTAAGELVGELVVVAQMGLGTRQLPAALIALRDRFHRLAVTVLEEPNPAELDRLGRRGVVDVALIAAPCEEGIVDVHHLGDEQFVVVLGAAHPLLAADRVALPELAGEPWIRFDHGSTLDGVLADVLRDAGLAPVLTRTPAGASSAAGPRL